MGRVAIPFNQLKTQHAALRAELRAAFERVLDSGYLVLVGEA